MAIIWDERTMGTGVPEIDEQHRELIRNLDVLLEAMKAGKSQDELSRILLFLGSYAGRHFRFEEDCMNRHRCPVAAANESAHRHFVKVFTEIADKVRAEGPKVSLVIRAERELADWVRTHIIGVDTHLRKCVAPLQA